MGDPTEKQPQYDSNTKRIKGALFEIVLLGGVATGCWLLGDHLQKNGYEMSGLFFTIIGACLFFATVPVLLAKLLPKRKRLIWFPSFILALILIFTMISTNHKIPPPPPPMFAFTLTYPGVRSTVLLTNRSLIITNAESVKLEYLPYIFIPITNTSEVSVRFGLCNFGAVALKSIEAWFSTPSVLNWKAG